jgi:cellobiose phosphorylase
VYCQMIAGKDAFKPGEGKNSWLTGTAAWNYYAITQWILGIRPDYDGLIIEPVIPDSMPGYRVSRIFRGTRVEIEVKNPKGLESGTLSLVVDGKPGGRKPDSHGIDHRRCHTGERDPELTRPRTAWPSAMPSGGGLPDF